MALVGRLELSDLHITQPVGNDTKLLALTLDMDRGAESDFIGLDDSTHLTKSKL